MEQMIPGWVVTLIGKLVLEAEATRIQAEAAKNTEESDD